AAGDDDVASFDRRRLPAGGALALFAGHEIGVDARAVAELAVVLEDVFRKERLAAARLRGHAADDHAVADDDLRIAREGEIRDGVELELRQLAAALLARQAADQNL